ncbi:MAG: MATE family efflux transporter [Oscillospiraceae bacterium]|nr:MATE family efflux transporter [Oscillospiraceae bacterium]
MKDHSQKMLQGPLLRNIVTYTIPVILTGVLQLLFNAADLMVVGRYCGSISVAAVGATTSLTNLIVNLFIGLSVGAGVTVAHALGAKNGDMVHRTVHTAIPAALVSGVVLTLVGVLFSESFLTLMGTPENVLPLSAVYMRIYFGGITFTLLYNFCASILRAAGDTRSPLIYLSISGVINVLLNLVFVMQLDMNVAGVALATVISQAISALALMRVLMRRTDACRLQLAQMRFHRPQLMKIIRIGLPAGIQSSLFGISNVLIQSSINSFGDILVSGNSAAQSIDGFLYVMMNAFHQTAVNFIGQNMGAGQQKRALKTLWICLGCTMVCGIAGGLFVYCFGEMLLSIYITDSAEAIACGMIRLTFVGLPYFVCGLMDVSTGALRGMGASVAPMIISVLGVCGLRIAWIATVFQIPQYHTPQSLYFSYPVSWVVTFAIQMLAFAIVYRRHTRAPALR